MKSIHREQPATVTSASTWINNAMSNDMSNYSVPYTLMDAAATRPDVFRDEADRFDGEKKAAADRLSKDNAQAEQLLTKEKAESDRS